MYRYYVLKVIFKQNKSESLVGLAGLTHRKSPMVNTLLFMKEMLFCMTFWSACARPTATSVQSRIPSHNDVRS